MTEGNPRNAPSSRAAAALLAGLLAATAWVAHASGRTASPIAPEAPEAPHRPRIDVVFVLDTTGSMSGLIEGAKQKVWSIASQLAAGQPAPEIRVGLVAYRDRGDAYVTRRVELTDDIDAVYGELRAFQAAGGGDGPESVNQALHEAVTRLDWRAGDDVYRVVFLVGDAPPHMDYDEIQYPEIARRAAQRGIVVNTVQCGSAGGTESVWREIARGGGGEYAAIAQDGGVVTVATPVDDELARLNRELAATVVPYGAEEQKAEFRRKLRNAVEAPAEVAASRLSYLERAGKRANLGRLDLVDALKEGSVALDAVPEAELPARLRILDAEEREAYLDTQAEKREALQKRIEVLVQERDSFVRKDAESRRARGDADGFDAKVLDTLRSQAAAKGIRYE